MPLSGTSAFLTSVLFWFLIYFTSPPFDLFYQQLELSLLPAKETSRGGYCGQKADLAKERGKEHRKSQEMLNIISFCCGCPKEQEKSFQCPKMIKVNNLRCGCQQQHMERTEEQKERQRKAAELLETHTCEQQGFIAPSSHQVKQDRAVPPPGRGGFMPVGPKGELPPPGSIVSFAVQKNIIWYICLEGQPSLISECMFYSGVILCKR